MKDLETMTELEKLEYYKAEAELASRRVWQAQDVLNKARKELTTMQERSRLAQDQYTLAYQRALREGHVVLSIPEKPSDKPDTSIDGPRYIGEYGD